MQEEAETTMSKPAKPGAEGKVVMIFATLITFSPVLIGPVLVAVTCGEHAQSGCSAYYWPATLFLTIPIGSMFGLIGLVMYIRDKKRG